MKTSWQDVFLLIGPLAEASLLAILLIRGRLLRFRLFTCFICADLISSIALNFTYFLGSASTYRDMYFVADALFFGLQIGVIAELARAVIRPAGKWVSQARRRFALYSLTGAGLAFLVSMLFHPAPLHGAPLDLLRIEVFGDLLMTEAVIAMLFASGSFGLGWSNHVMAIGQGMMALALTTVAVDGLALYFSPTTRVYQAAYYLRSVIYIMTMLYWCTALWREEPARKPISPALRKYIVALHDQVQYDLGKVRH